MHGNYHFMKTLTNERINERLVEAEVYRSGKTVTGGKSRRFTFGPLRNLFTAAATFVRRHPIPVLKWEFGRVRR